MPISREHYGIHDDVSIITFGTGDIFMTKCIEAGYNNENIICFSEIPGHKIFEESDLYAGESTDKLPNLKVIFRFENPESITALIHSLLELQECVFKNKR